MGEPEHYECNNCEGKDLIPDELQQLRDILSEYVKYPSNNFILSNVNEKLKIHYMRKI